MVVALTAIASAPASAADRSAGGRKLDAAALAAEIDKLIETRLTKEGATIAPPSDDGMFVRRAYLDFTGVVPPPEAAKAFLDDRRPDKRARLVEDLLAGEAYGVNLASRWRKLLLPVNGENQKVPRPPLERWLAQQFNENRRWDGVVNDLLTATGPQFVAPAVTPFMANAKPLAPHEAADVVSQAFLGIRLQCAQCHNHPFDSWTRADYWGFAAFFSKVDFTSKFDQEYPQPPKGKQRDEVGTNYGIKESSGGKPPKLPERALTVAPKFLNASVSLSDASEPPLRPALARWMTARDNPWFAKAMANRLWEQFFGRGIVNPVDDFRDDNPPSHPELIDLLAGQFTAHDFDVKFLVRSLTTTKAYRRTSRTPSAKVETDDVLYDHAIVKVMSPEQLFDSLRRVLGDAALTEKGKPIDEQVRERFVEFYSTDDEPDAAAYRRGIPQLLSLMNAVNYEKAISARAAELTANAKTPNDAIERLYLAALGRRPSPTEAQRMLAFAKGSSSAADAYSGVLWALVESSAFHLVP